MLAIGLALVIGAPLTKDSPKKETSLVGEWVAQKATTDGEERPPSKAEAVFEFTADGKVIVREGKKQPDPADYKADPKKDPAEIDVTPPAGAAAAAAVMKGIYKIDGDTLTICLGRGGERPTKFESPKGSNVMLLVLKRAKKQD